MSLVFHVLQRWRAVFPVLLLFSLLITLHSLDSTTLHRQDRPDWRGDPCSRAGIPWTPFTHHARLDPAAVSRVVTRSDRLAALVTREDITLEHGTEETIVVTFQVLLSDDALQEHVTMVQENNNVALVIDGSNIGGDGLEECVIAKTTVSLPPRLHHLEIDADKGSIRVKRLNATFDSLDLKTVVGDVDVVGDTLEADRFSVETVDGHVRIEGHVAAGRQEIKTQTGSIDAVVHPSALVKLQSIAGDIHAVLAMWAQDPDMAQVEILSTSGHVHVESRLRSGLDLNGTTECGAIRLAVPHSYAADVRLSTLSGEFQYPKALNIVSEDFSEDTHSLVATLGHKPFADSLNLQTTLGDILLIQDRHENL